ncbi:hypothetical protein SO694_00041163 [Aureococcus anophagefferens]|uniref:Uncharacterized protein n=1 Tax=Aureococcus anophagefferens TaxID=44056 RepID=A0ABR1G6V5_AURAN
MAPAPTTAVVVRCHDPTDAALARIGAWARSLDGSGVALVVWKLEDDVGYSGDLREFVGRFDAEPADLLTADAGHRPGSRWWWADAATPAYLAAYAPRDRLASREHAQRFSRRLLDRLHDLHGRGVTAWSEALAVTVCAAAPDLVLERLPPSVLGDPYAHDGRVSERAWRDVVDGRSARKKRKLYHALKF